MVSPYYDDYILLLGGEVDKINWHCCAICFFSWTNVTYLSSSLGESCTSDKWMFTCIHSMHNILWQHNKIMHIIVSHSHYRQRCGNSQLCRTLSDKSSECPVNWNSNCIQSIYWEKDTSGEKRSKCPAGGSKFTPLTIDQNNHN